MKPALKMFADDAREPQRWACGDCAPRTGEALVEITPEDVAMWDNEFQPCSGPLYCGWCGRGAMTGAQIEPPAPGFEKTPPPATTRVWSNLVLERRAMVGRYGRTGKHVHRVSTEWVVGVVDPTIEKPGTIGALFLRTGQAQLFSAHARCNGNRGQRGAHALEPLTPESAKTITCEKCGGAR